MTVRSARWTVVAVAIVTFAGAGACAGLLDINDRTIDPLLDASTLDAPSTPDSGDAGPPADAGPCGDTSGDPHNCGRCGHDCLGGDCSAGVCQAVAIVPPEAGAHPFHIAMQGQYIYWTDSLNNSVNRTDKQSLQTTNLYYGGFLDDGIAVDDASVYFSDNSNVYRCNLGGCAGTAEALAPNGSVTDTPYFVAVDDNGVYWDDEGTMQVHAIAKTGGPPRTIYAGSGDAGLAEVRADGQYVYVAGYDGTVLRIPNDGGASNVMNPGLQLPNAWGLVLDSQNVYWSQDDPNFGPGTINVVSRAGQSAHTFATNQPQPGNLAVDSQNLYWTNVGTNLNSLSGSVATCPLTSCANPVTLADSQHIPRGIVVDDVAVYWANYGNGDYDGSLMRVAKP